jgi:hydroxyethylthiazole kinase
VNDRLPGYLDPPASVGLAAVAQGAPLVHCMTNIVVAGFTANVLLAIGASPAMVENAVESADMAAGAGALLVNLGTLSDERGRAMPAAATAAHRAGTPWVLDPVAVGALAPRTSLARQLLESAPTIVRGNASEVISLAGVAGFAGRGVDSQAGSEVAVEPAKALAAEHSTVVAVSGAVDYVTDGHRVIDIPGGHGLMTKVTGVGCALGAVMAAYLGAGADPLSAAAGASLLFAAAGERSAGARTAAAAGTAAPGPGTFAVRFIDELAVLAAEAS